MGFVRGVYLWKALAGENYVLESSLQGEQVTGWIVDSQGKIVSPKISKAHLPDGSTVINVPEMQR